MWAAKAPSRPGSAASSTFSAGSHAPSHGFGSEFAEYEGGRGGGAGSRPGSGGTWGGAESMSARGAPSTARPGAGMPSGSVSARAPAVSVFQGEALAVDVQGLHRTLAEAQDVAALT